MRGPSTRQACACLGVFGLLYVQTLNLLSQTKSYNNPRTYTLSHKATDYPFRCLDSSNLKLGSILHKIDYLNFHLINQAYI